MHIAEAEATVKNEFINDQYKALHDELNGLKKTIYGKDFKSKAKKIPLPDLKITGSRG